MFTRSAALYDIIYSFKNYEKESERLRELIAQHQRSAGKRLLDVACGTGAHIEYLRGHFEIEGVDLDPQMVRLASERFPAIRFHRGDMIDFDLGRRFDVVTCLFSSIGYVKTAERMRAAVANLARHVCSGGVLIVEPWLTPEGYREGHLHGLFIDRPDIKIARMNLSEVRDGLSILNLHYMVGKPDRIEYFTERHELGLFTTEQYRDAFVAAGLQATHDPEGLMGRGLFIGARPLE
jgi:SAM-dependent methyltransferase